VFVRFAPSEMAIGNISGSISFQSNQAAEKNLSVLGVGVSIRPMITLNRTSISFPNTEVSQMSESIIVIINGDNLTAEIALNVSDAFQLSLDNINFTNSIVISESIVNDSNQFYVRFSPGVVGDLSGLLTAESIGADSVQIDLTGEGLPIVHNYPAFQNQRIAFGGGFNQTETAFFNLHSDNSNIQAIKMFIQLDCPSGGCNAWDVYANIKVRDVESGEWYEIGRYITPYGVDNSALDRGFEIDVTDFKSLLEGNTELFARIETWGSDGWELSVDFDFIEGTPDFQYYAVSEVIGYDDWSTSGVIYGSDASAFDLTKSVSIPVNAESTHLRTIISGWGHATPTDSDGRPCAEWCFRTHDIKINAANMFQHDMGPIGCASNPVSPQSGNWSPDRAGWCPGMAVPVRIDVFSSSMSGATFNFEYDYEDWTSDGGNTSGQGGAYYATSTFVVVKSNSPIVKPTVTN